jgi:PPE-repeat protein
MAMQYSTQTVTNLGTTTLNILNTDIYTINVTLQIPNLIPTPTAGAGGGAGTGTNPAVTTEVPSQVVATVKQNGTTVATSSAGQKGITVPGLSCTAGDVITVTLSSSLAQDQQPNAVQATIALSEGPI